MHMKKIIFPLISLWITTLSFAQDYKISGNEVVIAKAVSFETGSAKLTLESDEALTIVKQYLDDKSYISRLRIEGHLATDGSQQLSEQRALAVCKRLVELGVDCKRLIAVGFGNTKPVADNGTPEGRSQNTRISFINVALLGHLIGGMPEDGGGHIAGDVCE